MSDDLAPKTKYEALLQMFTEEGYALTKKLENLQNEFPEVRKALDATLERVTIQFMAQMKEAEEFLQKHSLAVNDHLKRIDEALFTHKLRIDEEITTSIRNNVRAAEKALEMAAPTLASEVVRVRLKEDILPILKPAMESFLMRSKELEAVSRGFDREVESSLEKIRAIPHYRPWKYPFFAVVSGMLLAMTVMGFTGRWGWTRTAEEAALISDGRYLAFLWPTLDEKTRNDFNKRVQQAMEEARRKVE